MRGKRSKQYRKLMQQYNLTFGFREPYQVLVDAQMIQDTERFKMDLAAGLVRTLQGQIKPMITQCSIRHLYSLPSSIPQAQRNVLVDIGRTFERRRCNHHTLDEPLSTLDCYKDVIDPKSSNTNKNRYIVASQDEEVRRWCRGIKGVPTVYVKRSVMVMEPMADTSAGVKEGMERGKLREGIKSKGNKRKRDFVEEEETTTKREVNTAEGVETKKRKIKGVKGPNPLSVKKPKRQSVKADEDASSKQDLIEFSKDGVITQEASNDMGNSVDRKKRKRKHRSSKSHTIISDGDEDNTSAT